MKIALDSKERRTEERNMKDIIGFPPADSVGKDIAIQVFLRENLRRREISKSL